MKIKIAAYNKAFAVIAVDDKQAAEHFFFIELNN
jgi:hypothetical protein